MSVQQADVINNVESWVFCLEISANALFVNNGSEVKTVRNKLGHKYVVKSKIIRVWQHGDPRNRQRLFMVGFHRDLGQAAYEFEFPNGIFNNNRWSPARDVVVCDTAVPKEYWRTDSVPTIDKCVDDFVPTNLFKIGSKGDQMGPVRSPNAVYSWDGLLNGQTTLNGGGRRPTLDWKLGDGINITRLCVPTEPVRAASLPSDYAEFTGTFSDGKPKDDFLRLCVNYT